MQDDPSGNRLCVKVADAFGVRCRMILRCADGPTNKAVAAELGVHEHTVGKWRRRFLKERIEGLSDKPRPRRPGTLTDEQVIGAASCGSIIALIHSVS